MLCALCNYLTGTVAKPNGTAGVVMWCYDCNNGTSRKIKQLQKKDQLDRLREHRSRLGRPYGGATPIAVPVEAIVIGQGGTFDKIPTRLVETVEELITNFDVTSVTSAECLKRSDYAGKVPGEKSNRPTNRIDRQGPSRDGTHAKFAVQIGKKTYAGIEMPADRDFTIGTVRRAFRQSIEYTTYALLTFQ